MSSFSGQVAQSSDDADQIASSGVNSTSAATTNFGTSGIVPQNNLGWRFQNVTIAQGSAIIAAALSPYQVSGGTSSTGTLDCVAADNEATFTTTTNYLSGLALTGSGTSWTISTVGTTGFVTSADISPAVQAVISRGGWSPGNSLAPVLRGPSGGTIDFRTYDTSPSEATEISITYTAGGSPPSQVTGLNVNQYISAPTTEMEIYWSVPSGSPTSYTIERAPTLGGTFTTLATGVTATSYIDTGLTPGTEYAYQVAGVNGSGTGTYSTPAAYYTEDTGATSVTAAPVSTTQINVSWSPPSLGSTVSVIGYILKIDGSPVYAGTTPSYNATGLSPATTYSFQVQTETEVNDGAFSASEYDSFTNAVYATTLQPAVIPAKCNIIFPCVIEDEEFEEMPF